MGALLSRFHPQPSAPSQTKPHLLIDDIIYQHLSSVSFIPDPPIPSTPIPIPTACAQSATSPLYSLSPVVGGPLSSYDKVRLDRLLPTDRWTWEMATGQ